MGTNDMIISGETGLMKQDELYAPMLYYGATPRIAIDYISDIHLLHHRRYYNNDTCKTIRVIAKSLYDSMLSPRNRVPFCDSMTLLWNIQVFLGDISSSKDVTIAFYRQYRMNAVYHQYKQFKHKLVSAEDILAFERKRADIEHRSNKLAKYITKRKVEFKQLQTEINKHINYNKVIAPKGGLEDIEYYLRSSYYKKRNLPYSVTKKILMAADLKDKISELEKSKYELDCWLATAEGPGEIITLRDFKYQSNAPIGLVILGNHEYSDFADVDEAIKFYKEELEPLGYIVLQNEFIENERAVIYGGSGFAKYSYNFNADNLVCCRAMRGNRTYEIEQTTLFENGYVEAKRHARETGKCFICVAHYPIDSCLGQFDREAVYFTGHTHRNECVRTEEKTLYADNQLGYNKNGKYSDVICFKRATTDFVRNPYGEIEDGCYQTTPDTYLRFYDYVGEYIGEGKLIRKRCEMGELYVIKSQGYYGFFVVNNSGISIVNGGRTKKIALSKNIQWIYKNFNIVVGKYLAALEPLRMTQVRISYELKKLGFEGTIHGLIVDIDFFNHIMVNPINGTIAFYYSPKPGVVQQFKSFQKQLEFMHQEGLLRNKNIALECNELATSNLNILAGVDNDDMLDNGVLVSLKTGAYGVSRAVNPLQRLFTGHVLRDFDLRLVEVEDESSMRRKVSLRGYVYRDENNNEYLVINDDLGEFITLLDRAGKKSVTTVLKMGTSMHKKEKITSLNETIDKYAEHGKPFPDAWSNALRQMHLKTLEMKK